MQTTMEGTPPYLVIMRHSVRMDDTDDAAVQQGGDGETCKTGQNTLLQQGDDEECKTEQNNIYNDNNDDDEMLSWPDRLSRPWDTPISDYKLPQMVLDTTIKSSLTFAAIYTSPFRRCLQTAAVAAVHLNINQIYIHFGLGEVMHRVRSSCRPSFGVMDGDDDQEANSYLLSDQACTKVVSLASVGKVKLGNITKCNNGSLTTTTTTIPPWNETYADSVARLERTLHELQQTHVTQRQENILVVTHGDALQAAATVFMGTPTINVYDLEYCALMVLDAHGKLQCHYGLKVLE